jgi:glycosyltransferase involved in cell wall biosynthesis
MVGPDERRVLLAGATAVFVPSMYLEPFGGVAVESLISGTPIITSDWGVFPEYNTSGLTGYRCRNMAAFVQAARSCLAGDIKSEACRERGEAFSLENVAPLYEAYFQDLLDLWTGGWETMER